MSEVVNAIDAYLTSLIAKPIEKDAIAEGVLKDAEDIRSKLSGAFGEAIEVCLGSGDELGCFFAEVPAKHLKSSGLNEVETFCIRGCDGTRGVKIKVVVGTPSAQENAANRVAKPLGEGYKVILDSSSSDLVYFRIDKV